MGCVVSLKAGSTTALSGAGCRAVPNGTTVERVRRHTLLCVRAKGPVHRYILPPREELSDLLVAAHWVGCAAREATRTDAVLSPF
jgi:hypothetical protein